MLELVADHLMLRDTPGVGLDVSRLHSASILFGDAAASPNGASSNLGGNGGGWVMDIGIRLDGVILLLSMMSLRSVKVKAPAESVEGSET